MKAQSHFCKIVAILAAMFLFAQVSWPAIEGVTMPPDDGKLRIICFGAHPDDCELQAGGTGAMWASKGHHVLFVSVTKDRKSTRLNSSHSQISYAVFCLKKK